MTSPGNQCSPPRASEPDDSLDAAHLQLLSLSNTLRLESGDPSSPPLPLGWHLYLPTCGRTQQDSGLQSRYARSSPQDQTSWDKTKEVREL